MKIKQSDRRRFLKESAALAGLAAATIRAASSQTPGSERPAVLPDDLHSYSRRSRFESSARSRGGDQPRTPVQDSAKTPLQDSVGIITPSDFHFLVFHSPSIQDIDPRQHRLLIHGMVDRPLILTLEDLKRLPSVSRVHFLECAGNSSPTTNRSAQTAQDTHGLTSCSEWTGVPLSLLLKETGVQKGASWLIAEGADAVKHSKSIPLEKAMEDVLVAYGQNGEAVRVEQGYPLRLVVPGFEGVNNVKWLRRIKVVDQPYMDKLESTGYPNLRTDGKARWFQFELEPKSVITFPSGGQRLPSRGFYQITGLAWSGGGAIRRVEVSTDGGRSWKDAQIQEPVHRMAHTRFGLAWNWDGEEAVLQSRCTDERGATQPTLAEVSKFWGVTPDYWYAPPSSDGLVNLANHFNTIQPWKVTRDGSVHNAMF